MAASAHFSSWNNLTGLLYTPLLFFERVPRDALKSLYPRALFKAGVYVFTVRSSIILSLV